MKKVIILTANILLLFILFLAFRPKSTFTLPSRFTGKTVQSVEFIGLKEQEDGSYEFIPVQNIDEKDLQATCLTEKGYPLDPNVITDDIKALFEEGDFLDVRVEVEELDDGVRVRFLCLARPMIDQVIFLGLEELAETDLQDIAGIQAGDMYHKERIEQSLGGIRNKYIEEGLFNVIVTYKVEPVKDEGDDNLVNVVYRIDEGEEVKVEQISLLGPHKINDTYLRGIIETKEDGILSDGTFTRATWEMDKQKILAWYRQEGYLDAEITEENVTYEWVNPEKKEKRGIYISLKIKEGERYYFDKYTIEGNEIIDSSLFYKQFELRQPEQTPLTEFAQKVATRFGHPIDEDVVCNDTLYMKDKFMIAFEYGKKGYLFTRIIPKRNVSEREVVFNGKREVRKYVTYDLSIIEGSQAYIENIIIKGNDKTRDNVIRREVTFNEGELYNAEKVQNTREILYKLGYFEEVNIDIRPGSRSDKVNMIISVKEQNTGTLSLGGGYGTSSGFSIYASVSEKNLFGYGYKVGAKFEYGPYTNSASVYFTDPWFMNKPVSFTTSLFYSYNRYSSTSIYSDSSDYAYYWKETVGYSVGFGWRPVFRYTLGTTWVHSWKRIQNPTGNASEEVMRLEAIGMQEKRKLTFYGKYDSTDSSMNPTKGLSAYFGTSFVGGPLLGGDDHFMTMNPKAEYFYTPFTLPYLKKYPLVFQFRGSADFDLPPLGRSVIGQDPYDNPWLETEDRVYVGGVETLRGWTYYGDDDFPASWQNRLYHRILYGSEFRMPIHPEFLWMALFFDAGALYTDSFWEQYDENIDVIEEDKASGEVVDIKEVFSTDPLKYFRYGYGFGFRIQIPMLPLRFWWGKKAEWRGFSEGGFHTISDFEMQLQIGEISY